MAKALVGALLAIGFILLIIGAPFDITAMWVIGLLMIAAGLYIGLKPGGVLTKEQVIDKWGILIEHGQGGAEKVFKDTEHFIKESKAPSLEMKRKKIAPGLEPWLRKRSFLVVTDKKNLKMKPYQIFVNARDYGNNLDVSWYLTFRPSWWLAILSLIPFLSVIPKEPSDLNLFDQQDLTAYATNAHHCLLKAVEKLMTGLHQDPSKIERKSRGFLGIS
jgi:hypothetical protein